MHLSCHLAILIFTESFRAICSQRFNRKQPNVLVRVKKIVIAGKRRGLALQLNSVANGLVGRKILTFVEKSKIIDV